MTALAGLPDIETAIDLGNFQDVKLRGDAQAFLGRLVARTSVSHFELMKPSLHDIFVRIAQPTAEDMKPPVGAAS
jgi:ABC-2 type transport system ATP-binding protein